ncbi:MAG TPA: ATP-binding protein, partial [Bacteroidales bacterium]|nr:ATP-binding protein [Bacteroidales bacterium]
AMVDSEQMTQLVSNLVKNSVDAMGGKGRIIVELSGDNDNAIISVWDNGPGIPKEKRDKIFEPFYTTKGTGEGTGLGLATAYGIVKMHRGKISVKSDDDSSKGETWTEFTVKIPRSSE